jgi:hypothetical protein
MIHQATSSSASSAGSAGILPALNIVARPNLTPALSAVHRIEFLARSASILFHSQFAFTIWSREFMMLIQPNPEDAIPCFLEPFPGALFLFSS